MAQPHPSARELDAEAKAAIDAHRKRMAKARLTITRLYNRLGQLVDSDSDATALAAVAKALDIHPDAPDPKEQRHRLDASITVEVVHFADRDPA